MFITFEGLDYSGKTTQAKLLLRKLRQGRKPVSYYREPGSTWLSEKIRETVLDSRHLIELKQTDISYVAEMFLFSAARTQLVQDKIKKDLSQGRVVICDRFHDSTTAYQGYGRNLNVDQVKKVNEIATLGIKPDVTFLLDIPVEEVMHRKSFDDLFHDRIESQAIEFYDRVRKGYLSLARDEPVRIVVLDGRRPSQEIHGEIWAEVQRRIKGRAGRARNSASDFPKEVNN